MPILFSASAYGFYDTDKFTYPSIPGDAVQITNAQHEALFQGLAEGKEIQADSAGRPVLVAPPEPTAEETLAAQREAMVITDIQFAKASLAAGLMTATEAEEWVANGALPTIAQTALDSIADADARAVARIEFRGARIIERNNPFIPLLQAALSLTDQQVDDLFIAGAAL